MTDVVSPPTGGAGARPLRLVVLVSGTGTNLQALLDASADGTAPFRVVAVGADRDGTGGVERAERAGIPAFVCRVPDYVTRADWDLDLERQISQHAPDLVAGGSLGQFRLSGVGAPAGRLFLALLVELGVGALVVVLRDAWRLRR